MDFPEKLYAARQLVLRNFRSNDRVTERALTELLELGGRRSPLVRQILYHLAGEGLLCLNGRGESATVPTMTKPQALAVVAARLKLEQVAAAALAQSKPTSSNDLSQLLDLHSTMAAIADSNVTSESRMAEFVELDCEFHAKLVDLSGVDSGASLFRNLFHRTQVLAKSSLRPGVMKEVLQEHKAITNAISCSTGIEMCVKQHLQTSVDRWFPDEANLARLL